MKYWLLGFLVLKAMNSFAQEDSMRSRHSLEFRGSGYTEEVYVDEANEAYLAFAPMTIKLTKFFENPDFEKISLEDLQLALVRAGFNTNPENRFIFGANGTAINFENQMFYSHIANGNYKQIKVMSLDVVGMFEVENDIYVQLRAGVGIGAQVGDASVFNLDQELKEEFSDVSGCIDCESKSWVQDKGRFSPYNIDTEVRVRVKKFTFSLITKRQDLGAVEYWFTGQPLTGNQYINSVGMTNMLKQKAQTYRLSYDVGQVRNFGNVSLFASYQIFNISQNLYNRTYTRERYGMIKGNPQESMNLYRTRIDEYSNINLGVSVNLGKSSQNKTPKIRE